MEGRGQRAATSRSVRSMLLCVEVPAGLIQLSNLPLFVTVELTALVGSLGAVPLNCRGGGDRRAQPTMRRLVIEAAMPQHDAAQSWRLKGQVLDLEGVCPAEFSRDLTAEHRHHV